MKKVLLINSPIFNRKVADKEDYLPSYGLGYIATELEKDFDVKIIDAVNENYTVEDILNIIDNENPDAVGINIFSVNFELVKRIIEECKATIKFIVGGKSTRFLYNDIVNFKTTNQINVTIGEGEYITKDIINDEVKESPIVDLNNRHVYLVNKNSIYFPNDLNKVKLNRNFFKDRAILNPYNEPEESIVTSRECLYNCAFCGGARSLNSDVTVRTRSKENIIKELEYIKEHNPEIKSIRILDDLFLKNRESIKDAIEIFRKFSFNWRAMSHIMSLKNNEDLFHDLLKSGCTELEIGIESGSDRIRKEIHKVGSAEDIKNVIKIVLEAGINVKGYVMYGLPGETKEEALATYDLIKKLVDYSKNTTGKFRGSAFQFRPYHGTELYNKINQNIEYKHNDNLNGMNGRNQFNFTAGNFSYYSDEEIENLVFKTNGYNEEQNVKRNR